MKKNKIIKDLDILLDKIQVVKPHDGVGLLKSFIKEMVPYSLGTKNMTITIGSTTVCKLQFTGISNEINITFKFGEEFIIINSFNSGNTWLIGPLFRSQGLDPAICDILRKGELSSTNIPHSMRNTLWP